MFFLLIMEILRALIRKADHWQLHRELGVCSIPHRASLYADDLIFFIRSCAMDLQVMEHIFAIFKGASRLGYKLAKCQLAPICCTLEDIELATSFLSCQVTEFPLKNLGVPLSITKKLSRHALQPFINKVVDYLPFWKGQMMNRSGRLALFKSTISAMTMHLAISLGLPTWMHKALEKIIKGFLWSDTDSMQGNA
jgi:hypothetical protein